MGYTMGMWRYGFQLNDPPHKDPPTQRMIGLLALIIDGGLALGCIRVSDILNPRPEPHRHSDRAGD